MRIFFILLIVNLFALSCKVQGTRLNVCPHFAGLTSYDSSFVFHILNHEECTKHCVIKVDSHIILTLKKKGFDRVYYLNYTGYIDHWVDMYPDRVIYSGKKSD